MISALLEMAIQLGKKTRMCETCHVSTFQKLLYVKRASIIFFPGRQSSVIWFRQVTIQFHEAMPFGYLMETLLVHVRFVFWVQAVAV